MEISQYGDTVHINQLGDITIKDYKKGDIEAPEELSTTSQMLIIDQAKYFNFAIEDIDKAQVRTALMDSAMQRTAYALADSTDNFIAGLMAKDAKIKIGSSTTPIVLTAENVYTTLIQLKVAMDKANVPSEGRWVVIPPEFEGLMLSDPTRFAGAYGANAEQRLINGFVTRACGFDIYTSNNVPVTAGKYSIVASNNTTTTFAEQIVSTEAFRPEASFKDAMKGLNVYGAKVTQGDAVAVLTATFTEPAK